MQGCYDESGDGVQEQIVLDLEANSNARMRRTGRHPDETSSEGLPISSQHCHGDGGPLICVFKRGLVTGIFMGYLLIYKVGS